jgi:hypothetical protein
MFYNFTKYIWRIFASKKISDEKLRLQRIRRIDPK